MITLNVISTKRHGLEVYQVTINGVVAHEFLSRQASMTCFYRLKQKYSSFK
jgi:hypothetical protein